MGAGREPAPATQRPDPQPGRDHQGLRPARGSGLQGHRRRAIEVARGQVAGRNDRRGQPAVVRPRPAARGRRELSAAEVERAVQPADGRARRHREPHRGRAHALQRSDSGVQHVARPVPVEHDGEDVRLQGISVLPGAARSEELRRRSALRNSRDRDSRGSAAMGTAALEQPPVAALAPPRRRALSAHRLPPPPAFPHRPF